MDQLSFEFTNAPEDADSLSRRRIREDLDKTFIVEASAGTGKTTMLIARMVALVETGNARAGELCAITFTKKAAQELISKFQEALEGRASECQGPPLERIEQALDERSSAFIGTIHAFCARMLRERPVEGGVPPDFEELDADQGAAFDQLVWEEWVEKALALGNDDLLELRRAGIRTSDLTGAFNWACGNLDVVLEEVDRPKPDLLKTVSDLLTWIETIPAVLPARSDASLARAIEQTRGIVSGAESISDHVAVRVLSLFESSSVNDGPKTWDGESDLRKRLNREMDKQLRPAIRRALTEWRAWLYPMVVRVVRPAAELAATRRRESGKLSFHDLLMLARRLLADHPEVREFFRKKYRYFLVDEFQDTDPIQTDIVFLLAGDLSASPGNLFIVGDPKQSIYRFRRADIALYMRVRERIIAAGGEILQLTKSFRSLPSICEHVNEVGRDFFPDEPTDRQAGFAGLESSREDTGTPGVYGRVTSDEEAPRQIARLIFDTRFGSAPKLRVGPAPAWRDFLVLTWDTLRIQKIADELEALAIPHRVTGGDTFRDSSELRLLHRMLQAMIDPNDEVALLAYLRLVCGISDDDLYRHRKAGGRWSFSAAVPDDSPETIRSAFELLLGFHEEGLELPPAALIGRVLDRTGLLSETLIQDRSSTRAGVILQFQSWARELSANGGATLPEIVDELGRLLESDTEIARHALGAGNEDAVRLMNLHQAKGLESRVVMLAHVDKKIQTKPVTEVVTRDHDSSEEPRARIAVVRKMGYTKRAIAAPDGWDESEQSERAFLEAERQRLLYVAATRARDVLVVESGLSSRKDIVGRWKDLVPPDLPLIDPPEKLPDPARTPDPIEPGDWGAVSGEIERSRRAMREVTHPDTSVTAGRHAAVPVGAAGRGHRWGSVVHMVLEGLSKDPGSDLAILARNALTEEGLASSLEDEVLEWVERFRASPLWKRAERSRRRFVEVPMAWPETLPDGTSRVVHGVIDLVFFDEGRWTVVDYKTDATAGRLGGLIEAYSPQIRAYVEAWSAVTGEKASGMLYFLDGALEIAVS
ncbi:MAG: UvrD-helicase domain-containing protein [Acidobacteria bacterium]|nr:UvrD-helicase domain-containing protein [Acidobacteriota bacterium]